MNIEKVQDTQKQAIADIDDINVKNFLQNIQNVDTRPFDNVNAYTKPVGEVQFDKNMYKATNKRVKTEMQKYTVLTKAQQQPNMLITFGEEQKKQIATIPDEVDELLLKAKIIQEQKPQTNFQEENSEVDAPIDVNEIILNQNQIKQQKGEILRLRAILLTNEQKLRQWAKIKSHKFRRIHNREQRQKKMNELMQKLNQVGQAGQVLGLDDYCQDIINQQLKQVNQNDLQNQNEDLELRQGDVSGENDKKGIMALRFMQNAMNKVDVLQEESSDEEVVDGEVVRKTKLRQVQSYQQIQKQKRSNFDRAQNYEDNPFLDGIDEPQKPTEINKKAEKVAKQIEEKMQRDDDIAKEELNKKLNYDPEHKYKQFITEKNIQKVNAAAAFEEDEIQKMKEGELKSQVDQNVQEQLLGWGEWAGEGLNEKEKKKLTFKQEIERQQRINEYLKLEAERADSGKVWFYKSQLPVNEEAKKRFNARGLNVSDEEYARYLKQTITPEFQSVSGFKYITQEERKIPRGLIINQQHQMEQNVKDLQKMQKQLEDQKIYVKGQKADTTTRKPKF